MTEREPIKNIVFACDAGMGSSAMGASVLRNKIKKAGIEDVTVVNKAIANLDGSADLVITQNQLTDRARQQTPNAVHVSVDNFMNSPKYDEVVDLVRDQHKDGALDADRVRDRTAAARCRGGLHLGGRRGVASARIRAKKEKQPMARRRPEQRAGAHPLRQRDAAKTR